MKKPVKYILLFLVLQVMFATSAAAYLDPSAMTYVIQIVAGIVITLGASLTIFRNKIKLFFKGKKDEKKKEELDKRETEMGLEKEGEDDVFDPLAEN